MPFTFRGIKETFNIPYDDARDILLSKHDRCPGNEWKGDGVLPTPYNGKVLVKYLEECEAKEKANSGEDGIGGCGMDQGKEVGPSKKRGKNRTSHMGSSTSNKRACLRSSSRISKQQNTVDDKDMQKNQGSTWWDFANSGCLAHFLGLCGCYPSQVSTQAQDKSTIPFQKLSNTSTLVITCAFVEHRKLTAQRSWRTATCLKTRSNVCGSTSIRFGKSCNCQSGCMCRAAEETC